MNIKSKKILFLIAWLSCLCSIIGVVSYNKIHNTYQNTAIRLQKKICDFDALSSEKFDKFVNENVEESDYFSFFDFNNSNFYTTLIYRDSSLLFWSNNKSSQPWFFSNNVKDKISETNNSVVYNKSFSHDDIIIIFQLPIICRYNIENQYVKNTFNKYLDVSDKYNVNTDSYDNIVIRDSDDNPLFSLVYDTSTYYYDVSNPPSYILLLFAILSLSLVLFYSNLSKKSQYPAAKYLLALGLFVALRLFFYQLTKTQIFNTDLYNYKIFDFSFLINTGGDLFCSAAFLLLFTLYTYNFLKINNIYIKKSSVTAKIFAVLLIFIITFCFTFAIYSLICNCENDILLLKLSNVNTSSVFLFASFLLLLSSCILLIAIIFFICFSGKLLLSSLWKIILAVTAASIVMTYLYTKTDTEKDYAFTENLYKHNFFRRNETLENNLSDLFNKLSADSSIVNNISKDNLLPNKQLVLINNFLEDYNKCKSLNNTSLNYIIADSSTTILIDGDSSVYNCNKYFSSFIKDNGIPTDVENLWFINDIYSIPYYIYSLSTENYNVWFDIIPDFNIEEIGYPELLSSDKNRNSAMNLSENSFGIYDNQELVRAIGYYSFPYYLDSSFINIENTHNYIIINKYKHYVFKDEQTGTRFIICKPYNFFNSTFSSFAFFFVALLLIYYVFSFISTNNLHKHTTPSLRTSIQNSSIAFFLAITLIIGVFSIILIISLNNRKNEKAIEEKTHSVCNDITDNINLFASGADIDFENILKRLSSIHFTDINVYEEDGYLAGTSNSEMFLNNLTSNLINATAFENLKIINRYIGTESIGSYKYLSSYIVFSHHDGSIYYLNIPYFTRQSTLKKEISDYIVIFINLYIIVIVISLIMTYFLSKIVTRPLEMLKEKLSLLSLGNKNEKIEYFQDDEIGNLVEVYNNKVDELMISAQLLAKSERENAWREMARQVAHEIKNPLTPMKLSSQYLYKLWKENDPDFDSHIKNYIAMMTTQIDTLSDIATSFSNFAKMPVANNSNINLIDVIKTSIDFYNQQEQIVSFYSDADIITVFADKSLLSRVFNNLIKNSIQAFSILNDDKKQLKININCKLNSDNTVIIDIIDNGPGISNEVKNKIFLPNFTTKSSGMGLGLAIVKNIIDNMEGTIENIECLSGAMFRIVLPIVK